MNFIYRILPILLLVQTSWAVEVENLRFDIDRDGRLDVVSLFLLANWNDPGEFTGVDISFANGKTFTLKNFTGISYAKGCFGKGFTGKLKSVNLLKSNRLVLMDESNASRLLFVFGHCYPASQELKVYRVSKNGITEVFDRDYFWLEKIEDLDQNGALDLVGKVCIPDVTGLKGDWGTYSPYQVITLSDVPALNESLTKAYNLQHYYGYVGPECSHDYSIIDVNGQKKLLKDKEARSVLGIK